MAKRIRSPVLPTAIAVALLVAAVWYVRSSSSGETLREAQRFTSVGCAPAVDLFAHHQSGPWLTVSGTVQRVLADSYGRFRHQRFVLHCSDGLHLLIVNDVSIGQRVPVGVNRPVTVRGRYIWDAQGGLVHFTHHGAAGSSGWILYGALVYQ